MKWLIPFLTILFMFGCGSGTVTVMYNEVSNDELQSICPSGDCGGFAEWNFNNSTCTIWMTSKESYGYESIYHEVLGHEMRHCLEGDWH